ncbi:MAG: shikimate kinase [Planctomycetota bacterium]|nr:shikimate kinase [Planctomycetota bacterium]
MNEILNCQANRLSDQLALSLFVENQDVLHQQLRQLNGLVKVVELRLDNAPTDLNLNTVVESYPNFEFILCNRAAPQSNYAIDPNPRLLIDWPLGEELPSELLAFRLIHSWHAEQNSKVEDLQEIASRLSAIRREGDLTKLVQWCDYVEDFELYANIDLCFAQGAASQFSRIVSLINGAPFMYVCLPQLQTADGQFDLVIALDRFSNGISEDTEMCGIVGDSTVSTSKSPQLWHSAVSDSFPEKQFAFLPLPVDDLERFEQLINACEFKALAVTNPHKVWAEKYALVASGYGAANFLLQCGQNYHAYSTDGVGALEALAEHSFTPENNLLVIGNGGASRAVVAFAIQHGIEVAVTARRPQLCADWGCEVYSFDEVDLQKFDAIIQATTLGSEQQPGCVLESHSMAAGTLALDMVYRPANTAWLKHASDCEAVPIMGIEMLIAQFRAQFELYAAKPPLVLIGMRGVGKSTIAAMVAKELGLQLLDIDQLLEQQHERDISSWLSEDPKSFRESEVEMLAAAQQNANCVIATGGGVVESPDGRELLKQSTQVVWLQCPPHQLVERIASSSRPALSGLALSDEVLMLCERREQWYQDCSQIAIDSSISIDETAQQVCEFYIN